MEGNIDSEEENLSWLQDFHATKIKPLITSTKYIGDDDINPYLGYCNYIPLENSPNIGFRISTVDNPGWSLEFNDKKGQIPKLYNFLPINIEEKTDRIIEYSYPIKTEIDSLNIDIRNDLYGSFSSILYLNLTIEFLKSWVNDTDSPTIDDLVSMRNRYKKNNLLLTWLEEFYFSCCDGDWEHNGGGGMGLIATYDGWIFSYPIIDLVYGDKYFNNVFESNIKCYKYKSLFVIRTHSHGLIEGLKIFKEWIES